MKIMAALVIVVAVVAIAVASKEIQAVEMLMVAISSMANLTTAIMWVKPFVIWILTNLGAATLDSDRQNLQ